MSFQGDISSISLGDVIQNLAANQKSGLLKVCRGDAEREILFVDGKAVSYADDQGFSIGTWFVEKELVTQDQLEEALRRYRKAKKKPLGEILRDLKLISLEDYTSYVSDLVRETIYEVLSYQDGTFEFVDGVDEDDPRHREAIALQLQFQAAALVMEAARRSDDWQKIRVHIPSENEVYVVPHTAREKALKEAGDDVAKEAIKLLDGTRSLRQVIAKMPYSRFDACRVLADLIAGKSARPIDGSVLSQLKKRKSDPREMIACLKAVLEREPNNRQILEDLVQLHTKVGQRSESATCAKLLAVSFLDDGDLAGAERWLRQSIELNPRDLVSWQKLLETVNRRNDKDRILATAGEFTAHFKKLGLLEIVRDHLFEMVKLFPDEMRLKLELADVRFTLGEHKECVDMLSALGLERLKKHRLEEAEEVFGLIVRYDRDNTKAKQCLETIRSGKLARRRALRQKIGRELLFVSLLLAAGAFLVYDFQVRGELFKIHRAVYAESLLEKGQQAEVVERLRALQNRYPLTSTALWEAPQLLEIIELRRQAAAQKLPGEYRTSLKRK